MVSNLWLSCSSLGLTWAWQLSPLVDINSCPRDLTSSIFPLVSSSSARSTCRSQDTYVRCINCLHQRHERNICHREKSFKVYKQYNLQHITGSLAVYLIHFSLCTIDPSIHFLYLSIQLVHLLLVVLKEIKKEKNQTLLLQTVTSTRAIFSKPGLILEPKQQINEKYNKTESQNDFSSISDQQQVEPFFCSRSHCNPVAVQQADFVVHKASVAAQHSL